MATIGLMKVSAVKTISGNSPQVVPYPEAASQNFKLGQPVYLAAGLLTELAAETTLPISILGFAADDASGTTNKMTNVWVANADTIFEANYTDGSLAAAVTSKTIVGGVYDLDIDDTNKKVHIASAQTKPIALIVGLSEKDAEGDTGGRVLFQIVPHARQMFGGYLRGAATADVASLIDAAGATHTVTVTGAAIGDFVLVSASVDLAGITVTGYVSAADTVSIRVQNESGGTVDLASAIWQVLVIPA